MPAADAASSETLSAALSSAATLSVGASFVPVTVISMLRGTVVCPSLKVQPTRIGRETPSGSMSNVPGGAVKVQVKRLPAAGSASITAGKVNISASAARSTRGASARSAMKRLVRAIVTLSLRSRSTTLNVPVAVNSPSPSSTVTGPVRLATRGASFVPLIVSVTSAVSSNP